jgi:predicted permease
MSGFVNIETNAGVIALAVVLAVIACVLSGLLPALRIAAVNWHEAIRQGSSRVVGGMRQEYLRGMLVVTEVALAVVLVIGASLLGRTLLEVLNVDPGFNADGVLTAVTIPPAASQGFEARNAFIDETLRRVSSIPGVTYAAYMSAAPFTWKGGILKFDVEGQLSEHDQGALNRQVTPDYFRTLEIPLRAGREFTDHDRLGSELVAIVNDALARRYLQGRNPIGTRIRVNGPGFTERWMTVVGVAGDVKEMGLLRPAHPIIYVPHSQTRADFNDPFQLAVRTGGDPISLAPAIRAELRGAWPAMPIANMRPMSAIVDLEMADRGPMAVLAGGLAGVALSLAAIGIYGLLAFSIAQRLPEIGVRMALGAQTLDVFRSVVSKGLGLAAWGTVAGLGLSLLMVQLMRGALYGVKPLDPATFILAPSAVIVIALLACVIPARSAIRVDPAQALRSE